VIEGYDGQAFNVRFFFFLNIKDRKKIAEAIAANLAGL